MPRACLLLPLLLCASVLVPSPGGAQTADQPVAGYVTKRWTTADGLPHNWISAALQTRDGYLWLGTNNAGLVRFDGLAFTTFNVLNTPALSSDTVSRLFEDRDGTLWVATAAGLVRYRDGAFVPEPVAGLSSPIADLNGDRDGALWVVGDGAVARQGDHGWTTVLRGAGVQRLTPARSGAMWMATADKVIEWRDRIVRTFDVPATAAESSMLAMREDRRGRLWLGMSSGLARLDPEGASALVERLSVVTTEVSSLLEDAAGVLWLGVPGGVVRIAPDGTRLSSALATDARPLRTATILEDREQNVWAGMEGWNGGLFRLKPASVAMLSLDGLPCDNIGAITEGPDATIWLSAFCDGATGVFALRNGRLTLHPGPTPVVASAMLAEPDGTVWVGTYGGGLYRIAGDSFEEIRTVVTGTENPVSALYRHSDGTLWAGTLRFGVMRLRGGQWTPLRASDGLPSDDVRSIVGGLNGDVWIGTTQGISRYHDGRLTTHRVEDGVPSGAVRALHVDRDGVVWAGTYGGGLARLKDEAWTRYGVRGGLLDSTVHRILEDDNGYLWLTGDRGIRRASKRDLNAVADGTGTALDVLLFDQTDGMRSIECNGMAQPAGWRTRDGAIYVPTQSGVARIDPARLASIPQIAPQPHVEQAIVDGTSSAPSDEVVVTPGYRDVALRYTAPAFARPEMVQFRYRLEGYSDEWIDVGTRRVASFANLPPGRYRFQLSARSGGTWSPEPATATLVLQPYFYQRRAVQAGLAGLAIALAGAGAWGYVRRTRRRASALEQAVAQRTSELATAHQIVSGAHADLAQAKQHVDQAHGQLLSVFDQLDIGVLVLNDRGLVRFASTAAQRVLQKGESALLDQPWSAALPLLETDRALVKARVERRSAGSGRLPTQLVIAGTRYWIEIDVRDEPPPGDGRILYMYDVAEMSGGPAGAGATGMFGLVGRSTAMHLLYKQIHDVARMDSTVLIQGETGAGKELVARAVHRESLRGDKPFIPVNAAGLSESLVASQLFGHRRGAFTGAVEDQVGVFEAAGGGTVFLDEIGDMPPGVQVSLLRVLQEREITRLGDTQPRRVDVRFLAATHRDLAREVETGRLREDLLYRIRVTTLAIPALRQRMDDVPLLVETFVAETAGHSNRVVPAVSREAMDALLRYDWPGNVRQLRAAVERALVNATGDLVRRDDLPPEILGSTIPDDMEEGSERERLLRALREAKGNRAEAARLLGINRTTLYRRLRRWGMDSESEK